MKTGLGHIELIVEQTVVQLLNVQQLNIEIQSLQVDFVFQNRMKRERVIGAS